VSELKLTKNELRAQQTRLGQLNKYLPTLQLKKAMLQTEVNEARIEIRQLMEHFAEARKTVESFSSLLTEKIAVDMSVVAHVENVDKTYENIAGVEIPIYNGVTFQKVEYRLFETPPWVDAAIDRIRYMSECRERARVSEEKKRALEKELREVSIRVNLFEKILIPRAINNIKKIKVFLGDQQLAAVSQAKVAKTKIVLRKKMKREELSYAY
jgi:V/A-type H+/Na+-transporting ATPase subunit D